MFNNIKHKKWLDEYTFDNCKLNRKEYGSFLCDYLTNEKDGFVLNLNGAWGSGKTEFLRRLYSELIERGHPAIYIDAWESDFSKDPLTVVSCELLQQIELINQQLVEHETLKRLNTFIGNSFKAGLTTIAGMASKKILDDYSIGIEVANKLFEETPESLLDKLKQNYNERTESISNIRNQLSLLADDLNCSFGLNLPIIVLIDELDRCRPTYAVEMLEVIKHFFKTKHYVFIVATDTDQLSHSINAIYGSRFNSKQYLKRFFDRSAQLPEPDISSYLNTISLLPENCNNAITLFPLNSNNLSIQNQIKFTALAFDLTIRDIDQLIYKLVACLRHALEIESRTKKHQIINILALIIGIAEYDKEHESYYNRDNYSTAALTNTKPIDLANDLTFQSFVNDCMKTTSLKKQTMENKTHHRMVNYKDFPETNNQQSSIKQSLYNLLIDDIIQIGNKYHRNQHLVKFWLWNDYKTVIELAGHLS